MSNILNDLPYEFSDQQLVMSVLMTPSYINFGGRAHGGFLLKLLDEAAYVCVARYWGGYAFTAAMHQAQFLKPVYIGELVSIYGSVDYTGRSSMDVSLNVLAENVRDKTLRYVHSCFVTMVAVDENQKPTPVKSFVPQTEQEKIRFERAKVHREFLQEYETRIKQVK
ncbi:MAG: acyl-CoA thioesterase [Saezia sp.]